MSAKKFRSDVTEQIAVSLGLVWTVRTLESGFLSTFIHSVSSKSRFMTIYFPTFIAMESVD